MPGRGRPLLLSPPIEEVMQMQQQVWREQAACRGFDTDLFFPETDEDAAPALAICQGCPVREACLEFALATNQADGVWGGTTPDERRRIRRRRRRQAA